MTNWDYTSAQPLRVDMYIPADDECVRLHIQSSCTDMNTSTYLYVSFTKFVGGVIRTVSLRELR